MRESRRITIPMTVMPLQTCSGESLNADNKVSLFVRYIDIATGAVQSKIINKNK